jgi:hypothetical protein
LRWIKPADDFHAIMQNMGSTASEPLPKRLEAGRMTMRDLVGIANAIEQEAVRRYDQLTRLMQQRGETATADAFGRMLEEERKPCCAAGVARPFARSNRERAGRASILSRR